MQPFGRRIQIGRPKDGSTRGVVGVWTAVALLTLSAIITLHAQQQKNGRRSGRAFEGAPPSEAAQPSPSETAPPGTVATPIGTTYSVHHLVAESAVEDCIFIFDPAQPPPGAPDDTVTFDGIPEAIRTDIFGTVPTVTESKTDNADGSHLLVIQTGSPSGTELFPGGVPCFSIGLAPPPFGDPLDWPGMDAVTSASISYLKDGIVVNGPFDVTESFGDPPWDGFFGHKLIEEAPAPGINGVRLDILVEKTPQGPLGACCAGGQCIGDVEEPSCQFQGGNWTIDASCGADPVLPPPVCDQTECGFNNGTWLDDEGAPPSQFAPDVPFSRAAADDFTLKSTGDNPCWINQVRTWVRNSGAGVNPITDYQGVNITIYSDADPKGPAGRPETDGTHRADELGSIVYSQTIPMSSVAVNARTSFCLPNVWQLDIPVNIILNKNTKYWLEVQPIMDDAAGNVFLLLSANNNDHPARQIAPNLGLDSWAEIPGNADACPLGNPPTPEEGSHNNLAFKLLGEKISAPLNDNCSWAFPAGDGVTAINNVGATTDGPDEPGRCGAEFGFTQIASDIWYEYRATCSGELTVSLCGSEYDTKLAVYEGCGTCPPPDPTIACNDDFCGVLAHQSQVSLEVVEGNCYTIRAGGFRGPEEQGKGIMTITCVPPPPPTGACCDRGTGNCRNDVLEADCDGAQEEWTAEVSCAALDPPCVIPPPPNDECVDCIPVFTGEPYSGTTVSATGTDETSCTFNDTLDVWHCWTADCTGTAVIDLCASSFDTSLAVFDACGGNELACNDDHCELQSELSPGNPSGIFQVLAGETYYIRVSGFRGATGAYTLNVEPCANACCWVDPGSGRNMCAVGTPEQCDSVNGTLQGPGTVCLGDRDGNGIADVCELVIMPDFDQNKDYDNLDGDDDPLTGADEFYCAPTATANALWWLDQEFEEAGVVPEEFTKLDLIEHLATQMGTNGTLAHPSPNGHPGPYAGTFLDDLQSGISDYLSKNRLTNVFEAHSETEPLYDSIVDHLSGGDAVILLLGFYHVEDVSPIGLPGPITGYVVNWRRTGGHYVTVAGVDQVAREIAISDPDADAAEEGAPGFLLGEDHDHDGDGDPTTRLPFRDPDYDHLRHNDKGLASHDAYEERPSSEGDPPTRRIPGGAWIVAVDGDPLAYGDLLASFHQEDAGGAFDVEEPTFLSVDFLEDNGYPVPAVCQTYTVVESAVVISVLGERACCFPGGSCRIAAPTDCRGQGGVPLGEGATCAGDNDGSGVDDACTGCLNVGFAEIFPPDGTIDARQPHPPNEAALRQGIGSSLEPIVIALDPPVDGAESCFDLCETRPDPVLGPNMIESVDYRGNGEYEIILHHPIAPGAVTTIEYTGSGRHVTYINHPGNSDGDTKATAADLTNLLDCCLKGNCEPPLGAYGCDMDRSNHLSPADMLRGLDLLMGAEEFDVWLDTQRPVNSSCPGND